MFKQFLMAVWESLLQPAFLLLYAATSTVLLKLKRNFHLALKRPVVFSMGVTCNDKHIEQ
jgi:hypothetical protein